MKKLQIILAVAGLLLFIVFTPAVSLVFTPMSMLGMGIGALLSVIGWQLPFVVATAKKHKAVTRVVCVLTALALCWATYCSVLLIAAGTRKAEDSDTVIVLGCQLKGDQPSKMLRQRLDKAYDYLMQNPDAVAIMSGGQGDDEIMPEGQAMYNYLVKRGIDSHRLFVEAQSHNTQQNMSFCAEIIKENGLDTDVVVITQAFHQYRASVYAAEAGLNAYALNCKTNPGTFPTYWLRELFGIVKMYLVLYT